MNTKIIYSIIFILSIGFSNINAGNNYTNPDTLTMGQGYANDLFYSMETGLVASIERAGWDIAFYTSAFSAGIIINEGNSVDLFAYPNGDTSSWNNMDTTGLNTWTHLVNSNEYWEDGAFNRNAKGHPDYGWGVYNSVTHGVVGDSLFIIDVPTVGFKKLWIVEKVSVQNTYYIKYANIDGSDEQTVEIDVKPYTDKNFIYFSLLTNEVIDREPMDNWDLLFTKYFDFTPDNEGNMVEYLVTGATSNVNRFAGKFYPVSNEFDDWSAKPFDSLKNVVGYNWKTFDMASFQWQIEDSTVFFVKTEVGDVYKLMFDFWEGSATGVFGLTTNMVSAAFINDKKETPSLLNVYPNPANNWLNISFNTDIAVEGKLIITEISGRTVYGQTVGNSDNPTLRIETSGFLPGMYFVIFNNGNLKESANFIVR